MIYNNDLQTQQTTEKEEALIIALTRVLQDNIKILTMIEEILEIPSQDHQSHLDLLIERIERGNNK